MKDENSRSWENMPLQRINFTLSLHFFTPGSARNHLDLFLDFGEEFLSHFSIERENYKSLLSGRETTVTAGTPHRKKYLSYSGPVSNSRGHVRVISRGVLNFSGNRGRREKKITCDRQSAEIYMNDVSAD